MKAPALVAVDAPAEAFAALFAAASERGARLGWLDLDAAVEAPAPLAGAAAAGAFKSVAVGSGRVVAVKRTSGRAVLRDLVREHFLGCVAVLVRGGAGKPRLTVDKDGFHLEPLAGRSRRLDAAALLAELARPEHRA